MLKGWPTDWSTWWSGTTLCCNSLPATHYPATNSPATRYPATRYPATHCRHIDELAEELLGDVRGHTPPDAEALAARTDYLGLGVNPLLQQP